LALTVALSSRQLAVKQDAAEALLDISSSSCSNRKQKMAGTPGLLRALADLVGPGNEAKVQIAAAGALGNMSGGSDTVRAQMAAMPGIGEMLVAALGPDSAPAVHNDALWALTNMSLGSDSIKALVARPETLAHVVALAGLSSDEEHRVSPGCPAVEGGCARQRGQGGCHCGSCGGRHDGLVRMEHSRTERWMCCGSLLHCHSGAASN
jgi:hypothetical protein